VSKRVGPAVVRNRLRRRLRGVLVELARSGELGLPGGALLVAPGPELVQRTPDELRNDVRSLLEALEHRRSATEPR
jgi:ribonuclease P protein component